MRNVSGHQEGENERQWKKVNRNKHIICSIKRVTMRSLEVFPVLVFQSNGKEMYKKSLLQV